MLLVALAAGLGAVCRYLLDRSVQHHVPGGFPWGTVLVNISGSFLLGLVVGLHASGSLSTGAMTTAGTGFLGGFTTLSTWAWETLALAEAKTWRPALANVVVSFGLGLAAAAMGFGLAML